MDVNSGERCSKIYNSDLTNEIAHGRTMDRPLMRWIYAWCPRRRRR